MAELTRATLVEISDYSTSGSSSERGEKVKVDFNPESLKLNLSNQSSGGNQQAGGATQYLGPGSSTMTVELLFDTSTTGSDVRQRTEALAYFIVGDSQDSNNRRTSPPKVRFEWGSFIYEGIIKSMDETLEYFSETGVPLRAKVSLSFQRDALVLYQRNRRSGRSERANEGVGDVTPLSTARAGDTLQSMAAGRGLSADWKAIAAANGIEDPLRLQPGQLIDLNARPLSPFG
jgi:hypothetical protein